MTAFAASSMGGEFAPVRKAPAQALAARQGGRILVKFKERTQVLTAATAGGARMGPQAAAQLSARLGIALVDGRVLGVRTQVLKSGALNSAALAARVAQESEVEWAEIDQRRFALAAPNDPLYPDGLTTATPVSGQWYLRAPSGAVKSGVDIETAWAITHGGTSANGTAIVIADLDTGITSHPDLVNKILPGYDFVGYNDNGAEGIATANDGDGADADPSDPGDWFSQADENSGVFDSSCNVISDSSWHGTQTAGILGAQTNNGIGMAGTAYDTMIVPVRVLGKCGGFDSDIIDGALWAGGIAVSGVPANAHPARVLNLSLGGSGACPSAYSDAIAQLTARNVLMVAAAGNDEGLAVGSPANCPGVVAVAGLRHTGTKVGFSDLGPEVTIASPGGNCVNTAGNQACLYPILTTLNTGITTPGSPTYSTSFEPLSIGTSFATPIVTGTVALMLAANPSLTNAQVIAFLKSSATPFPTTSDSAGVPVCQAPSSVTQDECICTTTTCGAGMLNAGLAVTLAAGTPVASIAGDTEMAVGGTLSLSGANSTAPSGRTIVSYVWQLTSGAGVVTLNASSGVTTTVTGVSPGTAVVDLTITDDLGASASTSTTVTVDAVGGGSGGGGGAANPLWLAGLALAGLLLTRRRRAG